MNPKAAARKRTARLGVSDFLAFIGDWGHPEWIVLAAEAPLDQVSGLLAAAHSAKRVQHEVSIRAAGKQDNEIAHLVAVVQCAKALWSVALVSLCLPIGEEDFKSAQDDARMLSAKLKTRALAFIGEDTSGAMGYHLYRNGREIEHKEWEQSKRRAADRAFGEIGLYLPACYPCTGRGENSPKIFALRPRTTGKQTDPSPLRKPRLVGIAVRGRIVGSASPGGPWEVWLAVANSSTSRIECADFIQYGERPGAKEAQALLNAVLRNRLPEARQLLRQGVRPTREALSKAVRKAVSSGKYDLLKELLRRRAGERLPFGPGVVSVALAKGPRNRRMDVVKLLLAAGADIDGEGGEALRTAVLQQDPVLLKFLLEVGADPNARKSWGSTPLHRAADLGQLECAKLLLQAGAKPDAVDDKGETPAQWAAQYGCKELAKLLEEATEAAALSLRCSP
jgi:hypothetical protein